MTKQAAPLLSDLPAYPGRPAPPVFAEFLLGYDSHASLIYACLVPFLALDLAVTIYQWVCFPVYGIPFSCRMETHALTGRRPKVARGWDDLKARELR